MISPVSHFDLQGARDLDSLKAFAKKASGAELQQLPSGISLWWLKTNAWATHTLKEFENLARPPPEGFGTAMFAGMAMLSMVAILVMGFVVGMWIRKFPVAPVDMNFGKDDPVMKLGLVVLDSKASLQEGPATTAGKPDSVYYTSKRRDGVKNQEITRVMHLQRRKPTADKKKD